MSLPPFVSFRRVLLCTVSLSTLIAITPVKASVVTYNVALPGKSLATVDNSYTLFDTTVAANFAAFDTSLGTLTGASFAYRYNFVYTQTTAGDYGSAGAVFDNGLNVNGTYTFTDQPDTNYLYASASPSVEGTVVATDLSTFASPSVFNDDISGILNGGGPPGFTFSSALSLADSSVAVTYTYTPVTAGAATVPEPSLPALASVGLLALTVKRRRRAARPSQPRCAG